jgi:hypothetical protein
MLSTFPVNASLFLIYLFFLTIPFREGKSHEFLVRFILLSHIPVRSMYSRQGTVLKQPVFWHTLCLWPSARITYENILNVRGQIFFQATSSLPVLWIKFVSNFHLRIGL